MKEVELEKYKKAWKTGQSFVEEKLSRTEIQEFMQSESKNISGLFKKNIIIDIVLKISLTLSFCVLAVLYSNQIQILLLNLVLAILTIISVVFQKKIYSNIPDGNRSDQSIKTVLKSYIDFHNHKYLHSLLISSLTGSFYFICGSLFYFYFKYGTIRPFELMDYLVFSTITVFAFVLSAFVQIKSSNFHIHQLEECLVFIEQNTLNGNQLKHYKKLKNRIIFFFSIFLLIGILLLVLILFQVK